MSTTPTVLELPGDTGAVRPPVSQFNKYQRHGAYHYNSTLGARSWRSYDLRLAARYLTAVKLLAPKPGEIVLDAGSGEGVAALLCRRRGARVIAAELDPEARRLGQQLAEREGLAGPDLTFVEEDLLALSLANASVDKAISLEVIEHMSDVPRYLCELKRVLRPGGALVVSTPLKRPDGRLQDRYHVEEFDHRSLEATLRLEFNRVKVWSCWPGQLNQEYESNRPFLPAAKLRRAYLRIRARRGFNPFVGPIAPDPACSLILATAVK